TTLFRSYRPVQALHTGRSCRVPPNHDRMANRAHEHRADTQPQDRQATPVPPCSSHGIYPGRAVRRRRERRGHEHVASDPEHVCWHDPRRDRGRLTVNKLHVPGALVTRVRELDDIPAGTIVLATSHPEPRYFLRHSSGWLACNARGDVTEHTTMRTQLDRWPAFHNSKDLRRHVTVVELAERQAVKC